MNQLVITVLQLAMALLVAAQSSPSIPIEQQQHAIAVATQAIQLATQILQSGGTSSAGQSVMQNAPPAASPSTVSGVRLNEIQDAHLVSMTDRVIASAVTPSDTTPPIEGEAVFAKLTDGHELLVYQTLTDDPRDLTNVTGQMTASQKSGIGFTVPAASAANIYWEDKYALYGRRTGNASNANHAPSTDEITDLITEVRVSGVPQQVYPVYYKNITFGTSEIKVAAADIVNIFGVTMTTGGSVYVLPISLKAGAPLNIIKDAKKPGAKADLEKLGADIMALARAEGILIAKNLAYHDVFYTFAGEMTGWVAWSDNVTLISP